jgi:hypothetical protein
MHCAVSMRCNTSQVNTAEKNFELDGRATLRLHVVNLQKGLENCPVAG